jgi:hypothetical protein
MIRSTASDSSKWTVVPTEFRIAWNEVEPNKLFDRHYYLSSISRIRRLLSCVHDLVLVAMPVLSSRMGDVFRKPAPAFFGRRTPRQLIVFGSAPAMAKQWRVSAGLDAASKSIRFEYIFEKRGESSALA